MNANIVREKKVCLMCQIEEENLDIFMKYLLHGPNNLKIEYTEIFGNTHGNQYTGAVSIRRRSQIRKTKLYDVGISPSMAPLLQDTVELQYAVANNFCLLQFGEI